MVDWLFGWIEPLAPEDFLEIHNWHHQYGSKRRAIFEGLGDRRYSGSLWRQIFGSWIGKKRKDQHETQDSQKGAGADSTDRSRPASLPHPYRILGLPADANSEQIRARFRELVKAHHPDKIQDANPAEVEEASRRLQKLIRAYEDLEKTGRV